MKALILYQTKQYPQLEELSLRQPNNNEVLIKLKAAAINHRDLYITQGLYAGIQLPVILGSDGVGVVDGREVIINPGYNWGKQEHFQNKKFQILGMPENGTFAENVIVSKTQVYDKPEHLNWHQAAALPLAGLTAYRALFTQGQLKEGQRVLITGIGGGVALIAFQMALASGAEVYVTSSSYDKLNQALEMGAKGVENYRMEDWHKQFLQQKLRFDLIIDSAGGDGFTKLLDLADFGSRIVVYGGTRGRVNGLSPQRLFWKQISIIGSTMGSPQDFENMLAFVIQHQITPVVDSVFQLSEVEQAFDRMKKGEQFGKIVFEV